MFTGLSYQSKDNALLEVNFIDNELKWGQGACTHHFPCLKELIDNKDLPQ